MVIDDALASRTCMIGFSLKDEETFSIDPSFRVNNFKLDTEVGAVVVGFNTTFNFLHMIQALAYLRQSNVIFINSEPDPFFPGITDTGEVMILPGTISLQKSEYWSDCIRMV